AVQESEAVQVRFTSKDIADVRYSRVVLEDFNGVIVREVFLDGAAGDVSLTMPPLTLAANYYVRIQTYFGDQLNYSESRVALRAVPKSSQVSAAVNVPLFVAAGAQLQLQRDSSAQVATGLLLLENEQGDVLASGEHQLSYRADSALSRLVVRSYVNDGKGNSDSRSYVVSVLAPAALQEQAAQASLSLVIPQVGATLYARGREVQNEQGQALFEVSQPVLDAAVIGQRIAVLTAEGIFIFDPELDYQQVANHPLTGMKGLQVNGHYLWSWSDSTLHTFTIFGNDLTSQTSHSLAADISGTAVHKGQLLFIAGDQAARGRAVLNTFTSSPRWRAEHDRAFWLQTEDGDLFRMRATDSKFVKVGNYGVAQQGLSLAGQLVLVTEQGELHWLNSDLMPALQDLGLSPALVKGGQLWISNGQLISNSGQHWQIAGDNEQRPAFIEQQKAGGSVRSMAWWQGRLFVAAAHYGAYQLTYDQTQWA